MTIPDWERHDPLWYDHTRKYLIKTFGLDRLEGNPEVRARHLLIALAYLNWEPVTEHGDGEEVTWEDIEDFMPLYGVQEQRNRYGTRYSTTMRLVDKILDAHGVEAVYESGGELNHQAGDIVMEFVNTGDTYNATVIFDLEKEEALVTTFGDWIEEWEKGVWGPDDIVSRLHTINVADSLLLADGSILVASPDELAEADSDDPETQRMMQEAINDGDAWCVFHVSGRAKIMDDSPLCGMVGYGDAEVAMRAFAEQMEWLLNNRNQFDPRGSQGAPPSAPKPPPAAPAAPPPQKTPHTETKPASLTEEEQGVVSWMIQQGWYNNLPDAVAHIRRMQKAGKWNPRGLHGFLEQPGKSGLMELRSWRKSRG